MNSIVQKNGRIFYYNNPAGFIQENRAIVDTMFRSDELARWLAGRNLVAEWNDGVYDRLAEGAPAALMDEGAEDFKSCRIWQIKTNVPDTMRFASYKTMEAHHGAPDLDCYDVAFDGQVGTNDLEAIYSRFSDKLAPGFSRTLAMSDLIELYDQGGSDFYYVDRTVLRRCEPVGSVPEQTQDMGMTMSM